MAPTTFRYFRDHLKPQYDLPKPQYSCSPANISEFDDKISQVFPLRIFPCPLFPRSRQQFSGFPPSCQLSLHWQLTISPFHDPPHLLPPALVAALLVSRFEASIPIIDRLPRQALSSRPQISTLWASPHMSHLQQPHYFPGPGNILITPTSSTPLFPTFCEHSVHRQPSNSQMSFSFRFFHTFLDS